MKLYNYDGDEIAHASEWNERQIAFVEAANDAGLNVRAYSGRGMYGAYCPGVSVDNLEDGLSLCPEIKGKCYDQLGMGYIVYLPR